MTSRSNPDYDYRPSVCPLDCPDACSLSVGIGDQRVADVRGSRANPYTAGVVCSKVALSYPEFVHGPNRLTRPLKRVGERGQGLFEPITWQQALELSTRGLQATVDRWGPQAVVPFNYAGPHGMLAGGSMDRRFFHRLGASLLERAPLCGGIRSEAYVGTFGAVPGMPPEQAENAELIVVWGNNVTVSNLHFQRVIRAVRKRGGKLVVVDPKRIRVTEQADLHLAIRPGTDVVLAFAVASELERLGALDQPFIDRWVSGFEPYMARARAYDARNAAEICGVSAASIRAFAQLYARSSPAALSIGNGLERNRNGGSGIRAVLALPALAGKFGVSGGGVVANAGSAFPVTTDRLERPDLAPAGTRSINIIDLPGMILDRSLDPPIGAVFIYNHNPVAVHPDQKQVIAALSHQDLFVIGCDVAMTDSMAYADVILPACTHFEHDDLFTSYGQQHLQRAKAVIPAVGESLPNTEIFRRLAACFGFTETEFVESDQELMDSALDADDARMRGWAPSAVPLDRSLPMLYGDEQPILCHNVFPATASGRIELESEYLAQRYAMALPEFRAPDPAWPLTLISPSSDKRTNSTFGGLATSDQAPMLEIHPHDAAERGLGDDDRVRIWNTRAEVHLRVRLTDALRQGVVCAAKGAWLRTSGDGLTINALTPAHKADLCEGACYNDTRVEVAAAQHPA